MSQFGKRFEDPVGNVHCALYRKQRLLLENDVTMNRSTCARKQIESPIWDERQFSRLTVASVPLAPT